MKRTSILLAIAMANFTIAQSYSNGELSTGSTAKNGTMAPAGYTWSELQNNTGNTTESNTSLGLGGTSSSSTASYFLADDFTIPTGEQWDIVSIDFFAYQTGYTGTTSPFNTVRVNIFSSDPSVSGATSVFGDDTTNRFASSVDALMYRTSNTMVPNTVTPGTTRAIWKVKANTPVKLNAGTYWIKYQLQNIVMANAGFLPSVTVVGSRGLPTFNAKQNDAISNTWTSIIDNGNPASAPDYPLDMPFVITYTKTTLGTTEVLQYDNRVRLYPNPAKNDFKLSIPKEILSKNVEIFDASGRLVKILPISENYNVSDLKSGVYTIKIKTDTESKVLRLIKD
ncbi:T9SS type A sorting domain-containing protein [Soonwooa sp.]|uniref:T9SS type A sorting domain-containing protein n=1 Tax=Soonwooa sp. TaxID=1938592 RepID=UPI0028ACBB3B|nr:T9SS type A sorting domain-containing protein [Soonwooa sp.]